MVSSAPHQTHAPVFPELSSRQTPHVPLLRMCTGLLTFTFNGDFLNEYQPKSTLLGTTLRKRGQCYVTFPTLGVCRMCTKAARQGFCCCVCTNSSRISGAVLSSLLPGPQCGASCFAHGRWLENICQNKKSLVDSTS